MDTSKEEILNPQKIVDKYKSLKLQEQEIVEELGTPFWSNGLF